MAAGSAVCSFCGCGAQAPAITAGEQNTSHTTCSIVPCRYEHKYPKSVCGYVGFKPDLERLLMAGGDFLLMPSRYEPCGIPQMIALTYGTVPIVHATGGLKDSVADVAATSDKANGYWVYPLNEAKMKEVLYAALDTYHNRKELHAMLQRNGMGCDFTWPRAVDAYERYFDYTLNDPPLYS